jgi:hypothetical protein
MILTSSCQVSSDELITDAVVIPRSGWWACS